MKSLCLIVLLCLTTIMWGQEITSYDFDVKIDVKSKEVFVKGFINIDFKDKDTITFLLSKNSVINEISSTNANIKYEFDTASASPMYIPDGKNLIVIKSEKDAGNQSLLIDYRLNASQINGWAKSFTEDWIELNMYSGWYPVFWGNSKAKFVIHIDSAYSVTGSGIVTKKENYWEIVKPWSSFDNVIVASKNLKSKILNISSGYIQVDYNNSGFSDADADSVINECKYSLNLYEKFFGKTDSTYLKFLIAPFDQGGGYSRKNFIRLGTKNFNLYTAKGIAHELAHFWWHNASTSTWEDWLNESFAEYCVLLYLRKRIGLNEYQQLIEEYKSRTENSPPIWGIDRNSPDSYTVLYEKGSLILCEFEEKIGKDKFLNFLKDIMLNKISTTDDLLVLMENKLSKEISTWFENKIKQ